MAQSTLQMPLFKTCSQYEHIFHLSDEKQILAVSRDFQVMQIKGTHQCQVFCIKNFRSSFFTTTQEILLHIFIYFSYAQPFHPSNKSTSGLSWYSTSTFVIKNWIYYSKNWKRRADIFFSRRGWLQATDSEGHPFFSQAIIGNTFSTFACNFFAWSTNVIDKITFPLPGGLRTDISWINTLTE